MILNIIMEENTINNTKSLKSNIMFNSLRTFLNIGFPLITFPYVTRILSPHGIGIYDFNKSIISYFTLIAGLGIYQYAVREGSKKKHNLEEFQQFCSEIFSINISSTIISYILLFIFMFLFSKTSDNNYLILIFSVQLIFNVLSVEWLFVISEEFKYITIRSFIVQLISLILLFVFVKTETDYFKYAMITVFSMGVSSLFNIVHSNTIVRLKFLIQFDKLKKHMRSIFILFFNNVASVIYLSSDTTIIGLISGSYYVGLYSTAVKIYTIVKQITNTILMTTIPRLASLNGKGNDEYTKLLNSVFEMMFLLITPSILGLIMLRKQVVLIIAGSEYIRSVTSLTILSVCLLFAVASAFFVHGILLINNREHIILKITIVSAIVNIILNILLVPNFRENGAAFSTLVSEILITIWGLFSSKDIFKIKLNIKAIYSVLIGCFLIFIICNISFHITSSIILQVLISISFSLLGYYSVLKIFKTLPQL